MEGSGGGTECRAEIAQRPLAGLQRELRALDERLDAAHEMLASSKRLAPGDEILFMGRRVAFRERRFRGGESRRQFRIDGDSSHKIFPFTPRHANPASRAGDIRVGGRRFEFSDQFGEPAMTPLASRRAASSFASRSGAVGGRLLLTPLCGRVLRGACALGLFDPRAFSRRLALGGSLDTFAFGRIGFRRRRRLRRGGSRRFSRLLRGAIVHLAHQRARAFRRALVLRPRRHLLEIVPAGETLDGRERGILELAVQCNAEDFALVLQGRKRAR